MKSKTMLDQSAQWPCVYEVGDALRVLNITLTQNIFLPFSSTLTEVSSLFIRFRLHSIPIIIINLPIQLKSLMRHTPNGYNLEEPSFLSFFLSPPRTSQYYLQHSSSICLMICKVHCSLRKCSKRVFYCQQAYTHMYIFKLTSELHREHSILVSPS